MKKHKNEIKDLEKIDRLFQVGKHYVKVNDFVEVIEPIAQRYRMKKQFDNVVASLCSLDADGEDNIYHGQFWFGGGVLPFMQKLIKKIEKSAGVKSGITFASKISTFP